MYAFSWGVKLIPVSDASAIFTERNTAMIEKTISLAE